MPVDFVKVCTVSEVPVGNMTEWPLGESGKVLLVNVAGHIRAYHPLCPHMEVPLANGVFDGKIITCIEHVWQFDADSGNGVDPEDACLGRYEVRIEGDDVWISTKPVVLPFAGESCV